MSKALYKFNLIVFLILYMQKLFEKNDEEVYLYFLSFTDKTPNKVWVILYYGQRADADGLCTSFISMD